MAALIIGCSLFAWFADYFFEQPGVLLFIIALIIIRMALG